MKRAAKILLWALVVIAALLLLLRLSLPFGVKRGVTAWFDQQGLQANIADVSFDFNDGSATLVGMSVADKVTGNETLKLDRLSVGWSWRNLNDQLAHIRFIRLQGLSLHVTQRDDALTVAGVNLTPSGEDNSASAHDKTTQPPDWRVRLGDISLSDMRVCYNTSHDARLDYCMLLQQLDWNGLLEYDLSRSGDKTPPLSAKGGLQLSLLRVHNNHLDRDLLALNALSMNKFVMDSTRSLRLATLRLESARLLQRETDSPAPEITRFDKLMLTRLSLQHLNTLSIDRVALDGHNLVMLRRKDGRFEYQDWLSTTTNKPASENKAVNSDAAAEQQSGKPFVFAVNRFEYTTDNSLLFVDNSLSQPFKVNINHITLTANHIDNSKPEQAIDIRFHATYNQHGVIDLQGAVQPFGKTRSFDIDSKLTGIDLRSMSAYTRDAIGHSIKSGQLDAKLKLRAAQDKLDSMLDLSLHHFEFKALSKQDAEKLDAAFGFPLNTSLRLLKDRDNSIRLSIPVTGDLNNPDFDPQDAINKALSKAITAAVINYYTPYGLVVAADALFSLATALRFDPAEFEPGSAVLSDEQGEALQKIASLMQQRPGVRLTLCGYSNAQDLKQLYPDIKSLDAPLSDEQRQTLLQLADKRAQAVKQALVSNQVDASRLVLCEPEYDKDGDLARVEISI